MHAADAITLETDSDLTSRPSGKISQKAGDDASIEGQNVNVKANSSLTIEATGDLTIKGGEHHRPVKRRRPGQRRNHLTRMSMHGDFIGSGLAFPLRVDRQGSLALVTHDDDIREAIAVILGTMPGERPMRPEFGCAIHDHVFSGIDGHTLGRIDHDVRVALDRWEPRAQVLQVDFDLSERDAGRLLIDITYRIRATNDVRNLVYPFYLVPSEEESE